MKSVGKAVVFDVKLLFCFLKILAWYNEQANKHLTEDGFPWIGQSVEVPAIAKPGSTAFSTISQFAEIQRVFLKYSLQNDSFSTMLQYHMVLHPVLVTRSELVTANKAHRAL